MFLLHISLSNCYFQINHCIATGDFDMNKKIFIFLGLITLSSHWLMADQVSQPAKNATLSLSQVFGASPIIYSALLFMSISAVVVWLYSLVNFRMKEAATPKTVKHLKAFLAEKNWQSALNYCEKNRSLLTQMISSALSTRKYGPEFMVDSMKSEGRRLTTPNWQKISILNDIVIIAPMLGLLGTVIGMFYAFYDINRSVESITSLFDGLGIAVGTTVAGLVVAIISMVFSSMLKYRLVKTLSRIENEAVDLSNLITHEKEER